jgi:hypothetical protein
MGYFDLSRLPKPSANISLNHSPRATLLPLREKVDRPQGETDEGCTEFPRATALVGTFHLSAPPTPLP